MTAFHSGEDRAFRMFSVIQDQQSRELSQGKTAKRAKQLKIEQAELKLPPVTDMAACQVRMMNMSHMTAIHVKQLLQIASLTDKLQPHISSR